MNSPITITYDEGNVHNSLSFSSSDPNLYAWCNPLTLYGEPRIEVHIGTRVLQFIIVERNGEDVNFSVEAISVSAKEDEFAEDITFTMDEPQMASVIAASLTNYCPVVWECGDWLVPKTFTFSGKPLDGIQQLASEIGAIVRCQDDGSLLVRKRRPVRPVNLPITPANVTYEDNTLLSLSHSEELASGYNAVDVYGFVDERALPELRIEEFSDGHSAVVGETVVVQIYWSGITPNVLSTFVTDGSIEVLDGGNFTTKTLKERVEFKEGKATVSSPIKEMLAHEWIGTAGGTITFEQNYKELELEDSTTDGFGIADVKYTTEYQRYRVYNHNVEMLIAAFFLNETNSIYASVRTADEPVYAPDVSAPLLTNTAAAVERGTAEIDNWKYRKSLLSIEVPYNDLAIDGNIAYIDDPHIQHIGNYHIKSASIVIDGPKRTNQLTVEQCLI